MSVGVVVSCYRQDRWIGRTAASIECALEGEDWRGVLEFVAPSDDPPLALSPRWQVLRSWDPATGAPRRALTPGAGRMAGLAACPGDLVLFSDSDMELDREWTTAALECVRRERGVAGVGGRLEEWFEQGGREWMNRRDMYGVGGADRAMDYLANVVIYRRDLLLAAGGYDPRLNSDEDFELCLRLRHQGYELRGLARLAARHWSAPRPSFPELGRRWRTGLCFGQGQVLRLYFGRRGFGTLLRRQWMFAAMLAIWALGLAALTLWALTADPRAVLAWSLLPLGLLAFMTLKKKSLRLGLHSIATWSLQGLGMLVGLMRPTPEMPRESAC